MLDSKIIIIHKDGNLEYIGDVNKNVLHYAYLINYMKYIYGNDDVRYLNFNQAIYRLTHNGDIVFLNMIGGKQNVGDLFLPNEINDHQQERLLNLADYLSSYKVTISYNMYLDNDELVGNQEFYQGNGNFRMLLCQLLFIMNFKDNKGRR